MDFALLLKNPVLRISAASTSGFTAAKSCGVRVFSEKAGRRFVHALIGALRREDRRHQQFPRVAMQQGASGAG